MKPRESTGIWRSSETRLLTVQFTRTKARKTCLPMLSSICVELTKFTRHQHLCDDLHISAEYLLFRVASVYRRFHLLC